MNFQIDEETRDAAQILFIILAVLAAVYTLAEFLTSDYYGACLGYCMTSNVINCQNEVLMSFLPKAVFIVGMLLLFYLFDDYTEPKKELKT